MAYLQVQSLNKSFGELKVLNNISFDVQKGEVVCLIGISGQGKTTLLRCINQLESFDEGKIILDGKELDYKNENQSKSFGMIFQGFNLFPQYNALENVTLALNNNSNATLKKNKIYFFKRKKMLKLEKQGNIEKATAILTSLGLKEKMNSYPCELSGGQCQRVAIARALALKPSVLCFDEPTSALDPKSITDIVNVIKELKKEKQTILIVTHDMSFAKTVSDKVLFIQNGQIECQGSPKEIFSKENTNPYWLTFLGSAEE